MPKFEIAYSASYIEYYYIRADTQEQAEEWVARGDLPNDSNMCVEWHHIETTEMPSLEDADHVAGALGLTSEDIRSMS